MAEESMRLFGEWDLWAEDVRPHVVRWHGRSDANAPLRAVEPFTARMPSVELRLLDGGHLGANRHEEILIGLLGRQLELAEIESRQCSARGDPGLREDTSEMELDRTWRDPALSGDLLVGHSLADQLRHLSLHRRELRQGGRITLASRLP